MEIAYIRDCLYTLIYVTDINFLCAKDATSQKKKKKKNVAEVFMVLFLMGSGTCSREATPSKLLLSPF